MGVLLHWPEPWFARRRVLDAWQTRYLDAWRLRERRVAILEIFREAGRWVS